MATAIVFWAVGCRPVQVTNQILKQGKVAARDTVQLLIRYLRDIQFLQVIAFGYIIYIFDQETETSD